MNQSLSPLRGREIAAVEHEVGILRHVTGEHRHLPCIRHLGGAEVESLVVAVGENVNRVILRVGIGVEIILNLAQRILRGIDLQNITSAKLGKHNIPVRDIGIDDDKLLPALFNRIGKRGNRHVRGSVDRNRFVNLRMNDRVVQIIRMDKLEIAVGRQRVDRRGVIQCGLHGKIPAVREMVANRVQIGGGHLSAVQLQMVRSGIRAGVAVRDKADGIIFPVMGVQIGVELLHRVGIVVENKHFGFVGKSVEIKVFRRVGINHDQFMRVGIGGKGVGEGKCRVGCDGKIGIQEVGKFGSVLLRHVGNVGKVPGTVNKLLRRILLNRVGTGQPRALILHGCAGFLNRRAVRPRIFRDGLRFLFLALGLGNVILPVGIGVARILHRFDRLGGSGGFKQHAVFQSEDLNLSLSSLLSHDRPSFPTILLLFFRLNQ